MDLTLFVNFGHNFLQDRRDNMGMRIVQTAVQPPTLKAANPCLPAVDDQGCEREFAVVGDCFEGQCDEVKRALEAMPQFLELLAGGLTSTDGIEQPVSIHFTNPLTFDADLQAQGIMPARIQHYKDLKVIGIYEPMTNQVWLMTANWKTPEVPLKLTGTACHELGHAIDDFLLQRTQDGKEVGFFTDSCASPFSRHWHAAVERAGVGNDEVNLYNQCYNRLVRELPTPSGPVIGDDEARQKMNEIGARLMKTFVSTYAATGYRTYDFNVNNQFVEFFAEGIQTYLDEDDWPKLYNRDYNFFAALDQLLHFRDRGETLAEAKVRMTEALDAPWVEQTELKISKRPHYFVVAEGDNLTQIGKRVGVDWPDLANYNRLEKPDLIVPGQILRVPDRRSP